MPQERTAERFGPTPDRIRRAAMDSWSGWFGGRAPPCRLESEGPPSRPGVDDPLVQVAHPLHRREGPHLGALGHQRLHPRACLLELVHLLCVGLLRPTCLAPVWWVAFNDFPPNQFTETQLVNQVLELAAAASWESVLDTSIRKDVDCLLRTYTVRQRGRSGPDEVLDCPFRELGLIEPTPGAGSSRFVDGPKPSLPDEIVAYACLRFMAENGNSRSISIARLSHDTGSPGGTFRLPERPLSEALSRAGSRVQAIQVAEPGGLRQVLVDDDPAALADQILTRYYQEAEVASAVRA